MNRQVEISALVPPPATRPERGGRFRCVVVALCVLMAGTVSSLAQQYPRVGYAYPAGGRQGSTFEVTLGGQHLKGATNVTITGEGVHATVLETTRPLNGKEKSTIRERMGKLREALQTIRKGDMQEEVLELPDLPAITGPDDTEAIEMWQEEHDRLRDMMYVDPKAQLNPQIAETAQLRVSIARHAAPGKRELRVASHTGISNPLLFDVGELPEYCEVEPSKKETGGVSIPDLPLVINGQILPGDVDRFRFSAKAGERLVIGAEARELIPYLADAVPGWFQAVLTLFDADGHELAFADDYKFHPDPVLFYEIPRDAEYVLEIRDAIYRGRQDFVYRIKVGALPFVKSVFPLGGCVGDRVHLALSGCNLPNPELTVTASDGASGVERVAVRRDGMLSNRVPFEFSNLPSVDEVEPNNDVQTAQPVRGAVFINGRIEQAGDVDVFRFRGRAGMQIVGEVRARRLGSPLDSILRLVDSDGHELVACDDNEDRSEGLVTHHADAFIQFKLPKDGAYCFVLGDTRDEGGEDHAYRLRISQPRPDFDVRVVPSAINARVGTCVELTVHAIRRDGFDGDISVRLDGSPEGFELHGGWVPAGADKVRMTLMVPTKPSEEPIELRMQASARIGEKIVSCPVMPAEDCMQAFLNRHLVPARQLLAMVTGKKRGRSNFPVPPEGPVRIPVGGTVAVRVPTAGKWFSDQALVELSDPPAGITIREVSADVGDLVIVLEAAKAGPDVGQKGNLIFDAFREQTVPAKDGKKRDIKRRVPTGVLPAIRYEVVVL